MPREKELFRDNLERLREVFPHTDVLTMDEACKYLRIDRRTLLQDRKNPAKKIAGKYVIPLINLASYLS